MSNELQLSNGSTEDRRRYYQSIVSEKIVADLVANDINYVTTVPYKQLAGFIDAIEASEHIYHIP